MIFKDLHRSVSNASAGISRLCQNQMRLLQSNDLCMYLKLPQKIREKTRTGFIWNWLWTKKYHSCLKQKCLGFTVKFSTLIKIKGSAFFAYPSIIKTSTFQRITQTRTHVFCYIKLFTILAESTGIPCLDLKKKKAKQSINVFFYSPKTTELLVTTLF